MSGNVKKAVVIVVAVVLVCYAIYTSWGSFVEPPVPADYRTLMDANTGELFKFEVDENWGPYPHVNPKTGERTLYPTELCFARECGKKKDGTHVILNVYLGKEGPTFCPECGALVVPFNPRPSESQGEE